MPSHTRSRSRRLRVLIGGVPPSTDDGSQAPDQPCGATPTKKKIKSRRRSMSMKVRRRRHRRTHHCPCPTSPSPPAYPRSAPEGGPAAVRACPGRTAPPTCHRPAQRLRLVFEHSADLPLVNAGEPFDELVDCGPTGEVLVERGQWNSRAGEDPRAADFPRFTLHRRACAPVRHPGRLALDCSRSRQVGFQGTALLR